jgi:hypothetical protein
MDQFLIYQSEDGQTKLDVRLEDKTLWLNQRAFWEGQRHDQRAH